MERGHNMNYKEVDEALQLAGVLIELEEVNNEIERLEYNKRKRNERKDQTSTK